MLVKPVPVLLTNCPVLFTTLPVRPVTPLTGVPDVELARPVPTVETVLPNEVTDVVTP